MGYTVRNILHSSPYHLPLSPLTTNMNACRGLDDLVEDSQTQTTSKDTVPALVHSKAEELAFRSRTARMEKLKKRRDAAKIYKELENTKQKDNDVQQGNSKDDPHSEDNDDYSLDAGPRARQRRLALEFKRINGKKNSSSYQSSSSTTTITGQNSQHSIGIRKLSSQSDSTASFGYGGDTTIHEGNEKEEEGGADGDDDHNHSIYDNKSNQPTIYHTLSVDTQHSAIQSLIEQKIDMLEWDRQEREHELDLMQEMIKYGQQVKEETKKIVRKAAKETAKNTAVNVCCSLSLSLERPFPSLTIPSLPPSCTPSFPPSLSISCLS